MSTCLRCPVELVPARTWQRATDAQRSEWLAEGKRLSQARGLCRGCYLKARRVGEIPRIRTLSRTLAPKASRHPCSRCGITTTAPDLCRDCREVCAA